MSVFDENGNEITVFDANGQPIDDPEGPQGLRGAKKAAEDRAATAEAALQDAQSAQRELGAIKAGLDPAQKSHAFFLSHYEGDYTPEAMKAAAIDAGIVPEIDPAAAESVAGQAQMAAAFQGGEHTPLGTAQVGDPAMRVTVPAEEAEMWQQFESKVKAGDMQGGLEVLRASGRQVTGIEDVTYEPGAGGPQTTPLSGRPF